MASDSVNILAAGSLEHGKKAHITMEIGEAFTEGVTKANFGHFRAMYNAVHLAMLNKVIIDNP